MTLPTLCWFVLGCVVPGCVPFHLIVIHQTYWKESKLEQQLGTINVISPQLQQSGDKTKGTKGSECSQHFIMKNKKMKSGAVSYS